MYSDGLVVAGHNIKLGHCIQVQNTMIIFTKCRFIDCIFREAVEIRSIPAV
jgi:hypothetical protein